MHPLDAGCIGSEGWTRASRAVLWHEAAYPHLSMDRPEAVTSRWRRWRARWRVDERVEGAAPLVSISAHGGTRYREAGRP